jgi:tetraacyldisaccharide 4'-kinase
MRRPWLAPFTPLYAAGLALRNLRIETGWGPVRRLRWPVVSIGNLSTGGTGKTPLTIALARALTQRGFQVDVLSRGYGRQGQLPARVDPDGAAEDFGDEPLLIAREAGVPVYVAAQRYQAGLMAEADACENTPCPILSRSMRKGGKPRTTTVDEENHPPIVHLLDDGFQHRQLARDVDILLLDRQDWTDNLLPAGNLREPLKSARRAGVIAIPADDPGLEAELKAWGWQGSVWQLHRKMEVPAIDGSVVAFCGIARPEQFFAGLEAAGLHIAAQLAFPDHHRYTAADLKRLAAAARTAGATALITTEKDQIRLGKLTSVFPESLPLKTAGLRVEIEDESAAINWLAGQLAPSSPHPPL